MRRAIGRNPRHFERQTVIEMASNRSTGDHHAAQYTIVVRDTGRVLHADWPPMVPMVEVNEVAGVLEGHRNQVKGHGQFRSEMKPPRPGRPGRRECGQLINEGCEASSLVHASSFGRFVSGPNAR